MTAAQAVGHFHLGQVKVLGEAALRLERHRILDKGGIGRIRRRKPEGHFGAFGFVLVGAFRVLLLLPFQDFLLLGLVVLAEIAANGFRQSGQLSLIVATICYKIGHHAGRFLPRKVRILKFCAAHVCAKYREKHRNQGFVHVF